MPNAALAGAVLQRLSGRLAQPRDLRAPVELVHDCAYTEEVGIEWDPVKAESNLRKHRIDFADAVSALEDENALTMEDPFCEAERRWVTLGVDSLGRMLVVVFTWRDDRIRLISARPAMPSERRQYEERR